MTSKKTTRRALFGSVMALLLCCSMLLGTTFAWFTDSVTSTGNIIKSGTLAVEMHWADGTKDPGAADTVWNDAATGAIFNYGLWEPGYTEVRHIKIKNVGTLALKYQLRILATGDVSDLADAIDVYFTDPAAQVADRTVLADVSPIGTLTEILAGMPKNTQGDLADGDSVVITLALKMRESAGNEYQDKEIGSSFAVQLLATQKDAEADSFDDQYDVDAPLDYVLVSNADELRTALANKEPNIMLTDDIAASEGYTVDYDANINGAGFAIKRGAAAADGVMLADAAGVYTDKIFTVKAGATLTLEDVVVDGSAVWTGEVNEVLQRGTVNSGVTATGALVTTEANSHIILGKGAVLQNNDGANAVNLGTRAGCTLTLNGGEIINNHSAVGAIWGGGAITINAGKVNGNHGGIGGAIRVVTNIGTVLTMNGGEMNHNLSDGVGGAIWAGSSRSNNVYVLNGGEMAYNYSAQAGGAMYAGYYETVKIGGTFKMHDNAAPAAGAIRFHNHAGFVMTGGEIYDNGENSLFLLNNSASITGGKITDSFGYGGGLGLTIGAADIDGVIAYDLSTNHNTAYLAAEFNGFSFTVNEADEHFVNFNFKPAAGYTYTEGDEAKLVCLNEGYTTYWDAATGTFRLQAN